MPDNTLDIWLINCRCMALKHSLKVLLKIEVPKHTHTFAPSSVRCPFQARWNNQMVSFPTGKNPNQSGGSSANHCVSFRKSWKDSVCVHAQLQTSVLCVCGGCVRVCLCMSPAIQSLRSSSRSSAVYFQPLWLISHQWPCSFRPQLLFTSKSTSVPDDLIPPPPPLPSPLSLYIWNPLFHSILSSLISLLPFACMLTVDCKTENTFM